MQEPQRPKPEIVASYIKKFSVTDAGISDRALTKLFALFPRNDDVELVLLKVAALNSLYYTQIFGVTRVAEHIVQQNIDGKLAQQNPHVVNEIARTEFAGKTRNNYSFATKYCSWHVPDAYPVFDSYVERLIWSYQLLDHFAAFKRGDLLDYPTYKKIVEQFRSHYRLTEFSFKELDKFLWKYGKEYFDKGSPPIQEQKP